MRTVCLAAIKRVSDGYFLTCEGWSPDVEDAQLYRDTSWIHLEKGEKIIPVWITGEITSEPPN